MPPLPLLVFAVGTGSLGAEIAAVRLLAPYFGASTIVWANTIGVVLVALSLGYWLGGRLADRHPTMRGLCLLALTAAGLLALVPFVADPLLDVAVDALDSISAGAFAGSLLGVLGLVAVPVLLLGAVSPYALRLAVSSVEEAGTVAGRLYAISTAGSLVGTLTSALLFIPLVGTRRTFLIFALAIAVVAVAGLRPRRRWALAPAAIAALMAVPVGTLKAEAENGRVIFETETPYQYARVVERPSGVRVLELNEGQAQHSRYEPGTVLTGDYWDGFLTMPFAALDGPPRRMAILGNAGGTTARAYARLFPGTWIDGVEIDAELSEIGRRYFHMRNPRLRLHHEDARPYLRQTDDALRRDRARHLPPALHPVLPQHGGVLRAGPRPAGARRGGGGERGPPGGPGRPREGAHAPRWARPSATWRATRSRTRTRSSPRATRRYPPSGSEPPIPSLPSGLRPTRPRGGGADRGTAHRAAASTRTTARRWSG